MSDNLENNDKIVITAKNIAQYLKVYNANTLSEIGYIGNITKYGLMLMTQWQVEVNHTYRMYIKLPKPCNNNDIIFLEARCQWCHMDVSGESFDSGYVLLTVTPEYEILRKGLMDYFSLKNPR